MIRQGDVLLTPTNESTNGMEPVERDGGRIVLAYGEVTGHAHAIADHGAELFRDPKQPDSRILKVAGNVVFLRHEEHTAHELVPGNYRVTQQREYSPEEIRRVED